MHVVLGCIIINLCNTCICDKLLEIFPGVVPSAQGNILFLRFSGWKEKKKEKAKPGSQV